MRIKINFFKIQKNNPSFSLNMTTFPPFSHMSLVFWIAAKTESRKYKYISKKVLQFFYSYLVNITKGESIQLTLGFWRELVLNLCMSGGMQTTGEKWWQEEKHGSSNSKEMKKKKGVNLLCLGKTPVVLICGLLLCEVFTPLHVIWCKGIVKKE